MPLATCDPSESNDRAPEPAQIRARSGRLGYRCHRPWSKAELCEADFRRVLTDPPSDVEPEFFGPAVFDRAYPPQTGFCKARGLPLPVSPQTDRIRTHKLCAQQGQIVKNGPRRIGHVSVMQAGGADMCREGVGLSIDECTRDSSGRRIWGSS